MVRRPACRRRRDLEAQAPKIELVEEDFDHPRRIVFADVVIQATRQQRRLPAILTLDETAHPKPPTRRCQESELLRVFTQPRSKAALCSQPVSGPSSQAAESPETGAMPTAPSGAARTQSAV